jgi:hypothetical protein
MEGDYSPLPLCGIPNVIYFVKVEGDYSPLPLCGIPNVISFVKVEGDYSPAAVRHPHRYIFIQVEGEITTC